MSKEVKAKKVLILGAGGMLAADLVKTFSASKKYKVIAWSRKDLDITDEVECHEKIKGLKPGIIINSAAYTAVDNAEKDFEKAMAINGYALKHLAEISASLGAILVHYGTDYIFDGKNPKGYKEDDEPNPANAYGQSKFVGEQMILMTMSHGLSGCSGCAKAHGGCHKMADNKPLKFYIIRASWLYGKNGPNFVETMLKLAEKRPELTVVNDQFGKPTHAADLATQTREIIEKDLPYGIYHFTNEAGKKGISWHDFAKEIFKIGKIKVKVKPVTTKKFYGSDKTRLASRPKYSMLVNTRLPKAKNWKEALKEYLKEE